MSDVTENTVDQVQKQKAVEAFILAVVTGAKTALLYKAGHTMVAQVASRVHAVLIAALGQDPNLTLDIKAKSVVFNETELTETPELVSFATTMHTVGIGQLLLTPRVLPEGLIEFFKILNTKADEKNTLSDLQKAIQLVRIDGMQMVFILSFVVTGETETVVQIPGRLSEEQISAFTAAKTLPDFLYLLFKQNEALTGKDAEAVTDLFDSVLNRELSIEKFSEAMPWPFYDPRIRARWDAFMASARWEPRAAQAKARRRWDRLSLVTQTAVFEDADIAVLHDHQAHEKKSALVYSLDLVRHVIDNPAGEKQPAFAVLAYARLLAELGHDGNVARLLQEYDYWLELAANGKAGASLALLHKQIQEKVVTEIFASNLVLYAAGLTKESPDFKKTVDFVVSLGEKVMPLILEELRKLADKDQRSRLCALLVEVCRRLGTKDLVAALADQDWFLVSNAVAIIVELNSPELFVHLVPLLNYHHRKVRETVVRLLAKSGGPQAAEGLAAFIVKSAEPEEAMAAVTALSQTGAPGVEAKLSDAYRKLSADPVAALAKYDIRVRIISVLGRVASTAAARALLEEVSYKLFWEYFTGINKDLRRAAKESLEQMDKEAKSHGKAG